MENRPGASPPPTEESVERVRSAAEQTLGDVKQAARNAATSVKDAVKEQTGALKDKAMGAMDEAQAKAAEQTRTAASTLRDTADGLNGELPWMKTALNKTADGFEHLTNALQRGDINTSLKAVGDFARRQPALFLGLSVGLGFALARVGKTAMEGFEPGATDSLASDGEVKDAVGPYAPVGEV